MLPRLWTATPLIRSYDDSGYGDKPADMNRVAYWSAHLSDKRLAEAMKCCNECPPEACVFASVKPPSSAPKCHACKTKIPRGELGVESRSVVPKLMPLAWDKSAMPFWKTQVLIRRCTAPACLEGLRLAGPIALVDLPEGKRVQGAALASALAMPLPTTAEVEPEAEAEADTDTDGTGPPAKRPKTDDPSIETTVAA